MIQSASVLPITERMAWGRATPPGPLLTEVDAAAQVDVVAYRQRDQELAYRDLIIASLIAEVAISVSDVWQFTAPRMQLPATVIGDLAYSPTDAPSGAFAPGAVSYVMNSSVPIDASATDQQLYARDVVLYTALQRAASVLVNSDLPVLDASMPASEAWSIAEGVQRALAGVGFNLPLDVRLFRDPDTDLAARDNQLAVFVAQLQLAMADIFERAGRLYVRAPAHEAEVYVLTAVTDEARVWSAYPLLPSGRLQVRYDRATKAVTWLGEDPVASNPVPQALVVPVAGGNLRVVPAVPTRPDAEFFRQKAARLFTRPYVDRVIFQTGSPQLYVTGGGLYQPDAVLLTVPGTVVFSLPILVPPGCVRVGVHVIPSRYIAVLGFLNRARSADGTAVTLTTPGTAYFDLQLPVGRVLVSLVLTDKTAATPAFEVEVTANGNLAFDGAFTFNTTPGTPVTTQAFEVDSPGGVVAIGVTWLGGAGQFTLLQLNLVAPVNPDTSLAYAVSAQLGPTQPSSTVQLEGVAERADVIWFDTIVGDTITAPTLGFTWSGGGGVALYVSGYDLRVFDVRPALPDSSAYEPHKSALAGAALNAAGDAYAAALRNGFTDPRADGLTWDAGANAAWLAAMVTNGEPRLLAAFPAGTPGDIGRPALVPGGLELVDAVPVVPSPLAQLAPTFVVLQAWMLPFGPRVAGPDFWPISDPGCASSGELGAITVTADFTWALTVPLVQEPYISALTAVSRIAGAPDGSEFTAYTIPNGGPGGGSLQQTVDLTVALTNVMANVSYLVTINIITEPVGGGAQTPGTIVVPVQPTDTAAEMVVPTIVAASGTQITVKSAQLNS